MQLKIPSGSLFILSAAFLFGSTGTAQTFAPEGIQPATTGALRLAIGGPVLLVLSLRILIQSGVQRPALLSIVISAAGVALFQFCFFEAVARTGVAIGTIVAMGSAPIIAGLLSRIFINERLKLNWMVAAALTIGGCGLLILPQGDIYVDAVGLTMALEPLGRPEALDKILTVPLEDR